MAIEDLYWPCSAARNFSSITDSGHEFIFIFTRAASDRDYGHIGFACGRPARGAGLTNDFSRVAAIFDKHCLIAMRQTIRRQTGA